jgi:hypothetical protein
LARNIAQCLDDYGIPLLLAHSVTRISGRDRVESVEIAPLVEGVPDAEKAMKFDCDTVLLSVGLIPENEFSKKIGVELSLATGGPLVDSALMTNVPGVFACGNALHVHDLADNVSEESRRCGASAFAWLNGGAKGVGIQGEVHAGSNLKYVLPAKYSPGSGQRFSMRALAPFEDAELSVTASGMELFKRKLRHVRPAEMLSFELSPDSLPRPDGGTPPPIQFSLRGKEANA